MTCSSLAAMAPAPYATHLAREDRFRLRGRSRAASGTPVRVWKLPAKEFFLPSCW